MGGTDLLDENTARYRISIRRKKWWWAIFTWLLDVSVVNAWNIYRQHENIKQLVFRRQIVQTYLTKYAVPPKGAGKPATSRSSVMTNFKPVPLCIDQKACVGGQREEESKDLEEVDNSDFFFENSDDSIADVDYIPDWNSSESDSSTHCSQLVETCNNTQVDCHISQIQDGDNMTRNDSSLESATTSFVRKNIIQRSAWYLPGK
ncbi:hypothetical protein JTB14_027434 [Gonioctena quinquepunctata]|nr:hypothetical protein JTB14_027434 [Gonioctena quinquepunctata]